MPANFLLITNNSIEMTYEGLGRTAFNCGKAQDPFGLACQEDYSEYVPRPSIRGKRNLSIILTKFIIDHPQSEFVDELKALDDSIWDSDSQEEIIGIIERAKEIAVEIY